MRSASRARETTSRAREALRASRVKTTTKTRRLAEAGVSAESLSLAMTATAPAPVPAPGLDTSPRKHTGDVAVDARTRRLGDGDFLRGSVACMAAEPNPCFPHKAATVVASTARRLRREMPENDMSVNDLELNSVTFSRGFH